MNEILEKANRQHQEHQVGPTQVEHAGLTGQARGIPGAQEAFGQQGLAGGHGPDIVVRG